jgi:hypothetical protein
MSGHGEIVAWLALAVSLGTFIWKFVETYVRWPRIGVVVRQSIDATVGPIGPEDAADSLNDKLHIVVVNNGAEAAIIANVGVRSEDRLSDVRVLQDLQDKGKEFEGPNLPAHIEAHGALEWITSYRLLNAIPKGTKVIGYVHRYQTVRRFPKSNRSPTRNRHAFRVDLQVYESTGRMVKN